MDVKWYFNNILISDINFSNGEPCGPFIVYNENGQKTIEASMTKVVYGFDDTLMRTNPVTYNDELRLVEPALCFS